jgi:peptidoglycan/LPS O-acetylase OafA/YrhL
VTNSPVAFEGGALPSSVPGPAGPRDREIQAPRPGEHNARPLYRPDIDGLRAVAVLLVVVFHAFPSALRGGFAGVDVFFVISGFLITSIIFRSLAHGSFSFADFYARRIRRIFPALIAVLAASVAFGWLALLADEFSQLGEHVAAGAGFVQNIVLASEVGYFDTDANLKPLLHLWSLAVEEQFYLAYPFLIWACWRLGWKVLIFLLVLGTLSFAANLVELHRDPVKAFFVLHTRFWELLAGSTLAYWRLKRSACSTDVEPSAGPVDWHNALAAVGLAALVAAICAVQGDGALPAWTMALLVAGVTVLIAAGPGAWINRNILANKALVAVGLISYPLYLWHWPILSFARIVESGLPSVPIRLAAVACSFALAFLTYRWIERPIRFGRLAAGATGAALASLMLLVGAAGYAIHAGDGLPFRKGMMIVVNEGDVGHLPYHKYVATRFNRCTPRHIADAAPRWGEFVRCMQSQENANVDIAVVGDSHAEHLFLGLAEALPDHNVAFYIQGGPPFPGNPEFSASYAHVIQSPTIRKVILTANWAGLMWMVPRGATLQDELLKIAIALLDRGKEVWIAESVPVYPFVPEMCHGVRRFSSKDVTCEIDRLSVEEYSAPYMNALSAAAAKEPRIQRLRLQRYLCTEVACSQAMNGKLLYRDSQHLNINGSRYIGSMLVRDYPGLAR